MRFLLRVSLKGLLLFAVVNLLLALWPDSRLGQLSGYNGLFPGRQRFPFGESPRASYNFSLFNLDAMFASHEISGPHLASEFRVIVIGDSSVWGTLLRPEETLSRQLNDQKRTAADGREVHFYNLGYPTLSLTKDLLLLDQAMAYEPDLVIWLVTLESFPRENQLTVPLVANNTRQAADFLIRYRLGGAEELEQPDFWQRTLVGRRKDLADLTRLQLYGVLWAATGVDQLYPDDYTRAQTDLDADRTFYKRESLTQGDLAFDVLVAGNQTLDGVPLLVVNEPILISRGANSDIRYNFYYPRWAYDQYRVWLELVAEEFNFAFLDAWDIVPPEEFTNSAIHINHRGTSRLAERIGTVVEREIGLER